MSANAGGIANHHQNGGTRPILVHQPDPGDVDMTDEEYYSYVETMNEIRMASGSDELSSRSWMADAEVQQWNGDEGEEPCYYVRVYNEDLIRAGITPEGAVEDKRYPHHIQLGAIGVDRAKTIQRDLHLLRYRVSLDLRKWASGTRQTGYLLVGGTLRGVLHARFAGWGIPPPLGQFHISF